jgi:chemotaxis protein CheX
VAFLERELSEFTRTIWSTTIRLEVQRVERLLHRAARCRTLAARVRFAGAFDGALVVHCNTVLASLAAAAMFGCEPDDAGPEELQDAVGEIANMTGGNLKSLLPEPSSVSLPSVTESSDYTAEAAGEEIVTQLAFDCRGDPIQVTLLRKQRP